MALIRAGSHGYVCPFCGTAEKGYDCKFINDDGSEYIHCHKTYGEPIGTKRLGTDGLEYKLIKNSSAEIGDFAIWVRWLSKEEWIAKKGDPNWKPIVKGGSQGLVKSQEKRGLIPGEVPCLSNEELDKRNKFFLNLLILESKHKESLLKEWESPIHDMSSLLKTYQIRSMPPEDKNRFVGDNKGLFKNPSRKELVAKCLEQFGDLRGWPMFYLRTGKYWEGKSEAERWTIAAPEGIIFPCYDVDGYLYRLRIKDDYPNFVLKMGSAEPIDGKYGYLQHCYSQEGKHQWWLVPDDNSDKVLVHQKGVVEKITLSAKLVPTVGKCKGKYKNLSSFFEKQVDGRSVNGMEQGCRSGVPYSLYSQPNDNYKVVIATEGEKKGMISNKIKKVPVLTVAGVSTFNVLFEKDKGVSVIDTLKKKGVSIFILAYDADKDTNQSVLKAQNVFADRLIEEGLTVMISNWSGRFDKGIDDILLMGVDINISPYKKASN